MARHSAVMVRILALLGLMLLSLDSPLMAATWQQQANLPILFQYDNNPLMQDTNITPIWKSTIDPHYSLIAVHDLSRWNADITFHVERTSDQSIAMNREDPSLGLGWNRDFENGQFGVRLGYAKSSSRATTLEETGRASGGDLTRVSKSAGVDLQFAINDKLSMSSSANASRMTFQGNAGSGAGSRAYAASVSLNYQYSEYFQPYLQLTANRSESDDALTPSTNVYGAVIGTNWNFLEQLTLGGNWGFNQVTGGSSGRGWQAAGNLSYAFEKSSFSMALSRSISPSANGGFISSDQISGGWRYDLTDRSRTGIDVSMRKNHGESKSESSQFSTWYERDLNPEWNLKASYQYKQSSSTDLQAHGSLLGLSLGYNFSEF